MYPHIKTNGVSTSIVGCRAEGGCHARNECHIHITLIAVSSAAHEYHYRAMHILCHSNLSVHLHFFQWRIYITGGTETAHLLSNTCHASCPWYSISYPELTVPYEENGIRNKHQTNSLEWISCFFKSLTTSLISSKHNAEHKLIIQLRAPSDQWMLIRFFPEPCDYPRISNICNKLICLWGGISNARNSSMPNCPMKNRGIHLSIQNSDDLVVAGYHKQVTKNSIVIQNGMKHLQAIARLTCIYYQMKRSHA